MTHCNLKKIILANIFLLTANVLFAQENIKKEIVDFTAEMKRKVDSFLTSANYYMEHGKDVRKSNFVFIPYYEFDGLKITGTQNYFDLLHISNDTTWLKYRINIIDDSLIVAPAMGVSSTFEDVHIYDYCIKDDPYFQMFLHARKLSPYCFALKIRGGEDPRGFVIIAYIEDNKLRLLGYKEWDAHGQVKLNKYDGIDEYIKVNYGSIDEYVN